MTLRLTLMSLKCQNRVLLINKSPQLKRNKSTKNAESDLGTQYWILILLIYLRLYNYYFIKMSRKSGPSVGKVQNLPFMCLAATDEDNL